MSPINSTLLIISAIVAYLIIVDKNVADYMTLVFRMTRMNIERMFWMIRLHPKNPITNLIRRWEYDKIARELQKEMEHSRD